MINYSHPIVQQDMQALAALPLPWDRLDGRRILVTGANGMLATYLVYLFHHLRATRGIRIDTTALSRNGKRSEALFGDLGDDVTLCAQDICQPLDQFGAMDLIFHLAGNASPHFILSDPTGILLSNLQGTVNVLELAKRTGSQVLFVSTREVYGEVKGRELLCETDFGVLDPAEARSCYPESKRAAEALLTAYGRQYNLHTNAVRLAHAYGPGMKLAGDGRVMADLLACAVEGRDIVLKSTGEAERAFCYLTDAIAGMLYIALYGQANEPYNLANETEPIQIRHLAQAIAALPHPAVDVTFDIPEKASAAYCAYRRVGLDTAKVRRLGWSPQVTLKEGLARTFEEVKS